MFLEPHFKGQRAGWIEVVCGCMFSGKTEELIRRLKRARIADLKVEVFKPLLDTRYDANNIVSHDTSSVLANPVERSEQLLQVNAETSVVGVDEAQFFDSEIANVCESLALRGMRVIVAGLDMDYLGNPFGQMPNLLAKADYITKLHAICVKCGNIANISYRKTKTEGQILLGEKDVYEPRCRHCCQLED